MPKIPGSSLSPGSVSSRQLSSRLPGQAVTARILALCPGMSAVILFAPQVPSTCPPHSVVNSQDVCVCRSPVNVLVTAPVVAVAAHAEVPGRCDAPAERVCTPLLIFHSAACSNSSVGAHGPPRCMSLGGRLAAHIPRGNRVGFFSTRAVMFAPCSRTLIAAQAFAGQRCKASHVPGTG